MVATMVTPSATRALTVVMTSLAVKLSRPEVGSSRNSTRGEVMREMPMFTRLAWPPLMPFSSGLPIFTCLHGVRPSFSSSVSTAAFLEASGSLRGRFSSAVYSIISSTVRMCSSVSNCST